MQGRSSVTTKHSSIPDRPSGVLILEGDQDVAGWLNGALSELAFKAVWRQDVEDGLERLEQQPELELVIANLRLRSANGDPVVRRVEQVHGCAVIPCDTECAHEMETAAAAAICGVLLWPPTVEHLESCIAHTWLRHRRLSTQAAEIESLRIRLDDRKIIERAKWALVEQFEITEPAAMRWLQKRSRSSRRPMRETAQAVLDLADASADTNGQLHLLI